MPTSPRQVARYVPVPLELQQEVRGLADDGHRYQAIRRLHRETELGVRSAVASTDVLLSGAAPPTDWPESAERLRGEQPALVREVESTLRAGDEARAVRLLRGRLALNPATSRQLVGQFTRMLNSAD